MLKNLKKRSPFEIADSEVVKLNGKEIHISFLEAQLTSIAESFEIITELQGQPEAQMGVVTDEQFAVRKHSPQIAYHKAVIKQV